MLKNTPKEQLELFQEELEDKKVKAITTKTFFQNHELISKTNIQVVNNQFAFGWTTNLDRSEKIETLVFTVEGEQSLYDDNVTVSRFDIFSTDAGYDIKIDFGPITTVVSIVTG